MDTQTSMKPFLVIAAIVATALVTGWLFLASPPEKPIDPHQILAVHQIAPNPDRFTGRIRVKGTVKNLFPDRSTFALGELTPPPNDAKKTDTKKPDCAQKKGSCCGTLLIPVKYNGPLPEKHSNIIVEGTIVNHESGKKFFHAEKITKI